MSKEYPDFVHHVGMGYQGRLIACPACVKAIHTALCNGHEDIEIKREQ